MSNKFEVNQQASIADLGTLISEVLFHLDDGDTNSVRDLLLDAHCSIYPSSSRTATPEENAKICAAEKTTSPISKIRALIDEMLMAGYSDEDGNALMSCICDIHRIALSTSEKDIEQRVSIETEIMRMQAFAHAIARLLDGADTGENWNLEHHPNHRLVSPDDLSAIQYLADGIYEHGEAAIKAVIQP